MNLVAKEYLTARHDEDGVLDPEPLHRRGRELTDALIVNPYDTEALADSIFQAIGWKRRNVNFACGGCVPS